MEQQTLNRPNTFDPEVRHYDDATTWFAEMVEGNMRTSFEYSFDGRELFGRDGGALKPIFEDAIKDAEQVADKQPNLVFELRRRQTEMKEYEEMIEMAKGSASNTMVVVSDFPEELMSADDDIGGYNVRRKQTMLRVITRESDGRIRVRSQSLDQSNREALEEIYESLGFEPQPGELLGQRMHLELDEADREFIIDQLMGVYDRSLEAQFGGQWRAGRQPVQYINTYDFVRDQTDLIDKYLSIKNTEVRESQAYSFAATMQKRFDDFVALHQTSTEPIYTYTLPNSQNLNDEMHTATEQAKKAGKSFSGCGKTVGPEGYTTEDELADSGYGNKADKETKYGFDKRMHCVVCQPNAKKDEPKKMCGPCGICRTCDFKLQRKIK